MFSTILYIEMRVIWKYQNTETYRIKDFVGHVTGKSWITKYSMIMLIIKQTDDNNDRPRFLFTTIMVARNNQ